MVLPAHLLGVVREADVEVGSWKHQVDVLSAMRCDSLCKKQETLGTGEGTSGPALERQIPKADVSTTAPLHVRCSAGAPPGFRARQPPGHRAGRGPSKPRANADAGWPMLRYRGSSCSRHPWRRGKEGSAILRSWWSGGSPSGVRRNSGPGQCGPRAPHNVFFLFFWRARRDVSRGKPNGRSGGGGLALKGDFLRVKQSATRDTGQNALHQCSRSRTRASPRIREPDSAVRPVVLRL